MVERYHHVAPPRNVIGEGFGGVLPAGSVLDNNNVNAQRTGAKPGDLYSQYFAEQSKSHGRDYTGKINEELLADDRSGGPGKRIPHILDEPGMPRLPGGAGLGPVLDDADNPVVYKDVPVDWDQVETPVDGGERDGSFQGYGHVSDPALQTSPLKPRKYAKDVQAEYGDTRAAALLQARGHLSPPVSPADIEGLRLQGITVQPGDKGRRADEYIERIRHNRAGQVPTPVTDSGYLSTPQDYAVTKYPQNIGGYLGEPGVRMPSRYSTDTRPGADAEAGYDAAQIPVPGGFNVGGAEDDVRVVFEFVGEVSLEEATEAIGELFPRLTTTTRRIQRFIKKGKIDPPRYTTNPHGGFPVPLVSANLLNKWLRDLMAIEVKKDRRAG